MLLLALLACNGSFSKQAATVLDRASAASQDSSGQSTASGERHIMLLLALLICNGSSSSCVFWTGLLLHFAL